MKLVMVPRLLRALAAMGCALPASWHAAVRQCQRDILAADPHPHYVQQYHRCELYTWLQIPRWLAELRATGFGADGILDIGCAYGTLALYTQRAYQCEVYALDYTDIYLSRQLRALPGWHFAVGDFERDPFPWQRRFPIILFTEVLEHLQLHPAVTFARLRELLTDDGRLFLSTPDAAEWGRATAYYASLADIPREGARLPEIAEHVWQYTFPELREVIEASGLRIEKAATAPGWVNRHLNLQITRA
jgi:SAM-dependent methyltransferase